LRVGLTRIQEDDLDDLRREARALPDRRLKHPRSQNDDSQPSGAT
jgi:hypothetical protein